MTGLRSRAGVNGAECAFLSDSVRPIRPECARLGLPYGTSRAHFLTTERMKPS